MKFEDLDRQIEECAQRLLTTKVQTSQPYASDPLTADHFLLKKSWAYFKDRIKSIEDQWQGILQAKDEQCRLLREKAQACENRIEELESDVKARELFDERLVELRLRDRQDFSNDAHRLKIIWEEERQAFQRTLQEQEDQLASARTTAEARTKNQEEAQKSLRDTIVQLRAEIDGRIMKQKDIENRWNSLKAQQQEEAESLQLKYDLIRQDRDRLAGLLGEAEASIRGLTGQLEEKGRDLQGLEAQLTQARQSLSLLNERYDILNKEKTALENIWNQEKAEWRELWERVRVSSDKSH